MAALVAREVRFVLIGGLAALAQGSPFPTEDVDITPEASRANLDRLSAALRDLDAKIRTAAVPEGVPFDHDGESLSTAGVWNLTTTHGWLDISMVPHGTEGFADLDRDAKDLEVMGLSVRVASLADVIRSKQAADRDKDNLVLPVLRRLLADRRLDTN